MKTIAVIFLLAVLLGVATAGKTCADHPILKRLKKFAEGVKDK
jgi:outer membrane lipoprotein-sorting protein